MGLFNTILVDCPECGTTVEFQTKSGKSLTLTYHISSVPEREVEGILGETRICPNCKAEILVGEKKDKEKDFSDLVSTDKVNY